MNKEGSASSQIVTEAAQGIVATLSKAKLKEFGRHNIIDLNRHWTLSLLHRMHFVQQKATTANGKDSLESFAEKKREFLVTTV